MVNTRNSWYQARRPQKGATVQARGQAVSQTPPKPKQTHIPAPPSFRMPAPKQLLDNKTTLLRGFDSHFDKATTMMEELHQKQLKVAKLREYLEKPAVQEVLKKPAELSDAQLEIDILAANIRHEISQATGNSPEKAWENLEKLGYKRPALPCIQLHPQSASLPPLTLLCPLLRTMPRMCMERSV